MNTSGDQQRALQVRSFIETSEGIRLFYQDFGSGRPLVFVHSWAMSSDMWQYTFGDFNESGFRCVAFDRRGHGRSDRPSNGYTLERLVDDLAAVLDELNLRDVTLVGHSLGGTEAVGYLARHGTTRVSRLVLLAPGTPFLSKTDDNECGIDVSAFAATAAAWKRDFSQWIVDGAEAFYRPATLGVGAGTVDWTVNMIRSTSLQVALQCGAVLASADLRSAMRDLRIPTLVIHGDADASIPVQFGRLSAQLVPGSKFIEYAGAPHGLFFTHRGQIHSDVCEWLATCSS